MTTRFSVRLCESCSRPIRDSASWAKRAMAAKPIRMVRELKPDILLLDLLMPIMPGLETLRELSTMTPPTRTLLLTAEVGDSDVIEALQFGARGVVMKQAASDMLFKSIRTVMAGQYWVGRECMGEVIDKMRARAAAPGPDPRRPTFGLTPRELEVVSTVVEGYPNGDIAQKILDQREDGEAPPHEHLRQARSLEPARTGPFRGSPPPRIGPRDTARLRPRPARPTVAPGGHVHRQSLPLPCPVGSTERAARSSPA